MLPSLNILFGFSAAGLLAHIVQVILSDMTLESSAGFGFGTLVSKLAFVTCLFRSYIFIVFSLFVIIAPFKSLAGWTDKNVIFSIVIEGFFGEDALSSTGVFLCVFQRPKMRFYTAILAGAR